MSLESFGDELRKQREQKQISLSAISETTRISEKMLESIEAGKFSILPQAYIRAFLRAYARALGLDAEDVLKRYDAVNQEIRTAAEAWISRAKPTPLRADRSLTDTVATTPRVSYQSLAIAAVILVAVAAVVYLANRGASAPPQETVSTVPFDRAVRESEASVPQPTPTVPPVVQRAVQDSLRLEITTTDSVWFLVIIDAVRRGEYLFPPGRTRTWTAKDQFVVSVGNSAAATFRLNGKDLGALGRRGTILRNVVITQSGVQQPQ
jgi:transcriptional regulator with XRE-family HTH domain